MTMSTRHLLARRVLATAALGLTVVGCSGQPAAPSSHSDGSVRSHSDGYNPDVVPPARGEPLAAGDITVTDCDVILTSGNPPYAYFNYSLRTDPAKKYVYRFSVEARDSAGTLLGVHSVELPYPPPGRPVVSGNRQSVLAPVGTHAVQGPGKCKVVQATRSAD